MMPPTEHISELANFYKRSEFQVFHGYAKRILSHVKTFYDLANAIVEKDISTMFSGVWDLVTIALCILYLLHHQNAPLVH